MSLSRWTSVIEATRSGAGLAALAPELGFGSPAPADPPTSGAIGLESTTDDVMLAAGPGTCRMLLVASTGGEPARDRATRIAARLSARAPHLLWLLALTVAGRDEFLMAAWHPGRGTTRIAALVVDRHNILPSDIDTLAALSTSMEGGDLAVHGRWVEILGREAISSRFFVTLRRLVAQLADGGEGDGSLDERREIALLQVCRMLFLAFVEARGWLASDPRFLAAWFDRCMVLGGGFQRRVLEPLFFGTLNTPVDRRSAKARSFGRVPFLNGGLFTRSPGESRLRSLVLRDADWGQFFDELLLRYRFTAAEETSEWREVAIDPEMLGRAFESLMAGRERRASGAFFTPLWLVERTTDRALDALLASHDVPEGTVAAILRGDRLGEHATARLRPVLAAIRVLDPACGSGAFLVHALDRITRLRCAVGDLGRPAVIRRDVVSRSVFGVDVNPTAVWLCELRLWLALLIDHPADDPMSVPPLPNLDHNIRCGDTLAGGDFSIDARSGTRDLAGARMRYARATGARKRALGRELDRAERARLLAWLDARLVQVAAERRALIVAARGRDLFGARRGSVLGERDALRNLRVASRGLREQRRSASRGGALPFAFAARFPDAAGAGGFDLVVGNPPWVRIHRIPTSSRELWRREFRVYGDAAWVSGTGAARAGRGFGSQVDVAALFIERGLQLLRGRGVLAFLVPAKLWRSLAGGGVRRLLSESSQVLALEDWSDAPPAFDAATYPSLLTAQRVAASGSSMSGGESVRLVVHRGRIEVGWNAVRSSLPLDATAGAPWLMLPPDARAAFDRLQRRGVPLGAAGLGIVTLGVKCGCNDAFLVRALPGGVARIEVTDGARRGSVDARHVRPVLRGEAVRPWTMFPNDERVLFPHSDSGRVLSPLPPDLRTWLLPWRARLEARSDARRAAAWWSLFRLEGSRHERPRVVWADIGRSLQALVLPVGSRAVPLNTCYVIPTRDLVDALAIAALLNSALADCWAAALAEPARGGYRRHFAWTMVRLPVPDDWARARQILAPLGERGIRNDAPGRGELLEAVLDAFRMRPSAVSALLEWMSR